GNFQEVSDRADAPLEDAVALMVRERLTGQAPPASSRKIVNLWRTWIEDRAGDDIAGLADKLDDQKRFAGAVRELLASLEMGDELGNEPGEEEEEGDESDEAENAEGNAEAEDSAESDQAEEADAASDEAEAGEGETSEADAEDQFDDSDLADSWDSGEPRRAEAPFTNLPQR